MKRWKRDKGKEEEEVEKAEQEMPAFDVVDIDEYFAKGNFLNNVFELKIQKAPREPPAGQHFKLGRSSCS